MNENTFYIRSFLVNSRRLSSEQICEVAGSILHGLPVDKRPPADKRADFIYESEVGVDQLSRHPVIKMARSKHVDDFFRVGSLQLGTFSYYKNFEHDEIGDREEGEVLIVGQSSSSTQFAEIGGGFNKYALCCYTGEPDPDCTKSFGYDACFEIVDIRRFAKAIAKAVRSRIFTFANCAYSKERVLVGETPEDYRLDDLSERTLGMVGVAKYFVKRDKFSNHKEFRFLWDMQSDVHQPLIIKCPRAVDFCRKR